MCNDQATVIVEPNEVLTTIEIQNECEDITIVVSGLGEQGLSAYQIAVINDGFVGTEEEWLNQWVPYENANRDVNLGANSLKADSLAISTTSEEPVDVGKIVWNAIDGTFDMGLVGGVTLQAGQELHIYAKATEIISNGDAVQFAGSQGDHLLIKKAVPSEINENPEYFIGIATQDFANNQFGYTTILGSVRGLNTTIYASPILYFDSANAQSGKLTTTMPIAPNAKIIVAAVVRSHATQGILKVRPHTMPKIKDLQDVSVSNPLQGQALYYKDGVLVNDWSWFQYASGFSQIPTLLSDIGGVKIFEYIYSFGTRYRKLDSTIDGFFLDLACTQLIVKKQL